MKNKQTVKDKEKVKVSVSTIPNGYSLDVGSHRYIYFNVDELIAGFLYHVALDERDYENKDFISAVVEAAADWKSGGDFVKKEAAKVIAMEAKLNEVKHNYRLLQYENKNLKNLLRMKGVDVPDD